MCRRNLFFSRIVFRIPRKKIGKRIVLFVPKWTFFNAKIKHFGTKKYYFPNILLFVGSAIDIVNLPQEVEYVVNRTLFFFFLTIVLL